MLLRSDHVWTIVQRYRDIWSFLQHLHIIETMTILPQTHSDVAEMCVHMLTVHSVNFTHSLNFRPSSRGMITEGPQVIMGSCECHQLHASPTHYQVMLPCAAAKWRRDTWDRQTGGGGVCRGGGVHGGYCGSTKYCTRMTIEPVPTDPKMHLLDPEIQTQRTNV